MRLLLHVGMGKTGSSTLQRTFRTNSKALARAGVLFPRGDSFPLKQHQGLMCLAVPPERLPREFGAIRSGTQRESRALADRLWADIHDQVDRARPQTVILSYESLLYLLPEEISELRRRLLELTTEIEVVAYVRHPSSHWLSVSQQRVKASHRINPPGTYHNAISAHLENFLDAFDGAVSARAFDPLVLLRGCIVADFVHHHIGDDALVDLLEVRNENESMSAEAMCIMQGLRLHAWPDQEDVFVPESDELLSVLRSLAAEGTQTVARLRPGIQAVLTRNHQTELDWLARTFDMAFPTAESQLSGSAGAEADARALESASFRDVLEVDADSVERTVYLALDQLARRSLEREHARTVEPGTAVRDDEPTQTPLRDRIRPVRRGRSVRRGR